MSSHRCSTTGTLIILFCLAPALAADSATPANADLCARLDAKPTTTQKPYSPAHEQVVDITPPPFIWVPVGPDARYVVQVSRSAAFDDGSVQTFRDITTSVFVPQHTLPAGRWYWRYGVTTGEGDVFGQPRPFTVARDARPFPFPDFGEVMAHIPKSRPRLLFPPAHLKRVRQAVKTELQDDIEGLIQSCRRAIGEELVAEPAVPKSGKERVQVMLATRPPMDMMERCALAYLLTGEAAIGQEAKRRIVHFFSWDPRGSTGLWGYDEPAMWVMMRGIRAYDWTYELFTEKERAVIEPVMKERARQFYVHLKEKKRFETNPYESHAGRLPGFLGEAALCFSHEWPEARKWLEYATLIYYTSYPAWGGDDGGWQEGTGYWAAYMNFALHFVTALHHCTGIDLTGKPFFRNTPYHALYLATPYHEHRHFGDGGMGGPRSNGQVLYAFASLLGDPYLRWHAEHVRLRVGQSLLALANYDPSLKARSPLALPGGRVFKSAGLASLHTALGDRNNDISFLMRSSPYGSVSHGHADQNAFAIEAFGRGLAIATGFYPWYGSPHHRDWTRATRAVNSVLVNGRGQIRRSWEAVGKITAFQLGDGYDYIEGEAGRAYGQAMKRFRRHVVHVQPGTFVIYDDLEAPEPSTYQWLLHAHDRIGIDGSVLTVRREPAAMRVSMLLPRDVAITQTDTYEPPVEVLDGRPQGYDTWHLTASTREPAETGRFLTVLQVHRADDAVKLADVELVEGTKAIGVQLTSADGVCDIVAFRTDGQAGKITCGPLTSRARVFAERHDKDGRTVRTFEIPAKGG